MVLWYAYILWLQTFYITRLTKPNYWKRSMIRYRDLTEKEKLIICNG